MGHTVHIGGDDGGAVVLSAGDLLVVAGEPSVPDSAVEVIGPYDEVRLRCCCDAVLIMAPHRPLLLYLQCCLHAQVRALQQCAEDLKSGAKVAHAVWFWLPPLVESADARAVEDCGSPKPSGVPPRWM